MVDIKILEDMTTRLVVHSESTRSDIAHHGKGENMLVIVAAKPMQN